MGRNVEEREDAFALLYSRHYGAIYAYAGRRVGTGMADEVAAETFLTAWRRWEAVPKRRAHDALTLERAFRADDVEFEADPILWTAWAQLRETDQEVLALVAWEELSVAEAARVLDCSAAVFSVRLHDRSAARRGKHPRV